MTKTAPFLNPAVGALCALGILVAPGIGLVGPVGAQQAVPDLSPPQVQTGPEALTGPAPQVGAQPQDGDPVDRLLRELARPDQPGWEQIEQAIVAEWSKSGSAAMDLLLSRGQKALSAGDPVTAIAHLTALTDHAPDFAEGWNARATAFFQADRYGPALADIERVLALEPRHFGALSGMAIILEQVGYPEDALEAWRAVEAIHPHRPAVKEAVERLEKEVSGQRL